MTGVAVVEAVVTGAPTVDPVVLQSGGTSNRGLVSLVMSLVFFLFGGVMLYSGFDQWRVKRLVRDTPTEKVRSIAVGRTELQGHARATNGTVDQPFTEGEALYVDWQVEEYSKDDDGGDWVTIDGGESARPFELDDGTGSVEVAASTDTVWEISTENETELTVEDGKSPPQAARSFLEDRWADSGRHVVSDDRRRYTQTALPPDEEVYVFGSAVESGAESTANEDRLRIERDDGSDRFIVSDMAESDLHDSLGQRAPTLMAVGLVVFVGGFYGILWSVGIA